MRRLFIFPPGVVSWGIIASVALIFLPGVSISQEEMASSMRRYRSHELSTGYYEEYEVLPQRMRPFVNISGVQRKIFQQHSSPAAPGIKNRLSDSHRGVAFYKNRKCQDCHVRETKGSHTVRAGISCRQCHGHEPIAGIDHYYSSMNPIRRHAYVCAKCHPGANASFATYVAHPPNPGTETAKKEFPALFYAFWIMMGIAVMTLAVFLPHTLLWGIRELFVRKEKDK